jgi:hypothetical protein
VEGEAHLVQVQADPAYQDGSPLNRPMPIAHRLSRKAGSSKLYQKKALSFELFLPSGEQLALSDLAVSSPSQIHGCTGATF